MVEAVALSTAAPEGFDELGQCRGGSVCAVMHRCCAYALFFGLGAAAILFFILGYHPLLILKNLTRIRL